MTHLLGIDIGTTHCKVGIFHKEGSCEGIVVKHTITHQDKDGTSYYVPSEIWGIIETAITEVLEQTGVTIDVIGITSMAETGVLVNRKTGEAVSPMIPWFDRRAEKEVEEISQQFDPFDRFVKTGLHPSFKYGLPKILWLKKKKPELLNDSVWLSASDFIAYCLSGEFATDYTLAARTYAFRIDTLEWDEEILTHYSLDRSLFPKAVPSGEIIGHVNTSKWNSLGIEQGTPIGISGHDHVCSSLGAGAYDVGSVFDSIGTAETLVGIVPKKELGIDDYQTGLTFGCHVVPHHFFWMGGLPASGGSVEWLRNLIGVDTLSYEEIARLMANTEPGPTNILYLPFLSGAGAPHPNSKMKGAFIGLTSNHGRAELTKSVLEGVSYQMEAILRVGQSAGNERITSLNVVGGGTKNEHWMQLKADVSNVPIHVLNIQEATLLGASLTVAIGAGIFKDAKEAVRSVQNEAKKQFFPNSERHDCYKQVFTKQYIPMVEMLNRNE